MNPNVETPSTPEAVITNLKSSILNEAAKITDRGTYTRSLEDRILIEDFTKTKMRNRRKESWTVGKGLYRKIDLSKPEVSLGDIREKSLHGAEAVMAAQLDELLERKKDTGLPVTLVDFGGGLGISMIRIAAQDKYREAIKQGRLLLVTTNLIYQHDDKPDSSGYTGVAKWANELTTREGNARIYLSKEELSFIEQHQQLVKYIAADAAELMVQKVSTATGQEIFLGGNIDILHEKYAIEHSEIPDVILAIFNKLLSANGTVYLGTRASNYINSSVMDSMTTPDGRVLDLTELQHEDARRLALTVGLNFLQNQSSTLTQVMNNTYSVFVKPHAPDFQAALAKG